MRRLEYFDRKRIWRLLGELHPRDLAYLLEAHPNADDLILVVHFDVNYFVDATWAMMDEQMMGEQMMGEQMMACHLKNRPRLNVLQVCPMMGGQKKDEKRDEMNHPLMVDVLIPFLSTPFRLDNSFYINLRMTDHKK